MRCHYEMLELSLGINSTVDEIKRQYRRLALQWHPDKNAGREEEATARFKDIGHAYAVLSDPRERKWYDAHRTEILRGSNAKDAGRRGLGESVDVWPFFSYRFAADFFATFDALFREVDDSEREAREGVRGGDGTYCSAPAFGTADSPANEVQAFYSHWTGYSSGLSFSGEDAFETTAAPNRDTRRAMEKENKKARDRARTDYVSALRSLVLYVKKMDPRYIRILHEEEAKKKAQTQRVEIKRKEEAALKKEKKKGFLLDSDELLRRAEERRGAFLLADDSSEDDDEKERSFLVTGLGSVALNDGVVEDTVFACLICDKSFGSQQQLLQHEANKVHRKKAQEALKKVSSSNRDLLKKPREVAVAVDTEQTVISDM